MRPSLVDSREALRRGEALLAEPVSRDFEYVVRLAVAIPLAWAVVLKTAGENHYDWKCREVAMHGVVNALYNVASFNEDSEVAGDSWPSTHPVAWNDCDGMLKILEQSARVSDPAVAGEIRAWLCRTMERIFSRHREVASKGDVVATTCSVLTVLAFREGTSWVVQALEQDVATQGDALLTAVTDLGRMFDARDDLALRTPGVPALAAYASGLGDADYVGVFPLGNARAARVYIGTASNARGTA